MKFTEFKKKVIKFPMFSAGQLKNLGGNYQVLKNQLNLWQKQDLVEKLKKGFYVLGQNERKIDPSRYFLASTLYSPSYVSVEQAMGFYGLIPERVYGITSVTTKKTTVIQNSFGRFSYQKIKVSAFGGFEQREDENGLPFFLALPEKAVVDFFYLKLGLFNVGDMDIFDGSYRFQNCEVLKVQRLKVFAKQFECKKLEKVVDNFCLFIKEQET